MRNVIVTTVIVVITILVTLAVWNVAVSIVKAEPENASSTADMSAIDTPVPIATPALGLPESSVELTCTDLGFAPFGEERYPRLYRHWQITEEMHPHNLCYDVENDKYEFVEYQRIDIDMIHSRFTEVFELTVNKYTNGYIDCNVEGAECKLDGNDIVIRLQNAYLDPLALE